jgi:hypothetical protein
LYETHLETTHGYELLTVHPLELARQVTLMESELFRAITPNELISLGWTRTKVEEKLRLSPNVMKLIYLSNKLTYWYAKCIVETGNLEERVAVVLRILDVASYLYEMNNFGGMKEIYAALDSSWVVRLQLTREKSNLEEHPMYIRFKQLFDVHEKGYLNRIKNCSNPCLPWIGTHLTMIYKKQDYNKLYTEDQRRDLLKHQELEQQKQQQNTTISARDVNLNESNESSNDELKSQLISFSKYRLLVEFVSDLLQYQSVPYKFRLHQRMRSFLNEDIDNYFDSAMNANLNSLSFGGIGNNETATQSVETWLFDKSKLIEPNNDKMG